MRQEGPVCDVPPQTRRRHAPDFGAARVFLECKLPRVECPGCGIRSAAVPRAGRASGFARELEEQVAWLAARAGKKAAAALMRIDRKSAGGICKRVCDRLDGRAGNRFDGLAGTGIDEASHKKGRKYTTVVLDHDAGRVAWCGEKHGKAVLESFFDLLAPEQRAAITVVTADGARWIAEVVEGKCPDAERVMDPFHVAGRMTDALDEVRRQARRRAGESERSGPKSPVGRPEKGDEKKPDKASEIKGKLENTSHESRWNEIEKSGFIWDFSLTDLNRETSR